MHTGLEYSVHKYRNSLAVVAPWTRMGVVHIAFLHPKVQRILEMMKKIRNIKKEYCDLDWQYSAYKFTRAGEYARPS